MNQRCIVADTMPFLVSAEMGYYPHLMDIFSLLATIYQPIFLSSSDFCKQCPPKVYKETFEIAGGRIFMSTTTIIIQIIIKL